MFSPARASFFTPCGFAGAAVLPGDDPRPEPRARQRHAQALAHAARRRRAAFASRQSGGPDLAYWKAGAPAALARAMAIRAEPQFPRLP